MTKAEELKVLDKIEALIKSAGEDSYIGPTFAGIVEICRSNIENDFGDHPLEDLEAARKKAVDLAKIAMDITDERDKLKEDFDELAGAYRQAVRANDAARPFVSMAVNDAKAALRDMPEQESDEEICAAFRNLKKAERAACLGYEAQQRAYSRPYVELMKEPEIA